MAMRKKEMNKNGQGHLEIILSFVLFIGALIFVFMFINPFAKTEEISVIGDIQEKIINNISLDVGKLSVIVGVENGCYNFNPDNYIGNYQEVNEGNIKYSIYFGEIFENVTQKKDSECLTDYTLGLYSKEEFIIYEKIKELATNYNSDYEGLKTSLGIANDFSFSFKNIVNEEISELSVSKETPIGVNIEAKEFPIRVINSTGDVNELILNLRAWR